MKITTKNFDEFVNGTLDYDKTSNRHTGMLLSPENADISGGKITTDEINILKKHPEADTLTVMGLTQNTFEYFIKNFGKQLKAVRFFKNKFVEDWSLLGGLPDLEFVYFYHNQRITSLWDMSGNFSLKGLNISDFTRLKSIKGIETAPALQIFEIGDAIWSTTVIKSFKPLTGTGIKHLGFYGKQIEDPDLTYVLEMKSLETFDFATNLFTTEQVAWMVANKPNVAGYALKPTVDYMGYNEKTGESDIPCVFVVGKRKPSLNVKMQSDRLQKYTENFNRLVKKYKDVPYSAAFSAK